MEQPPESPKLEAAAAVARGLVGLLPAGSLIVEVANQLNPLERRKQAWLIQVSEAINEIQERLEILPQELWADERFISFAWEASLIALKNHRSEKILALKKAIISTADSDAVEEDVAFQFLRYIDELTVTHIKLLSCMAMHAEKFTEVSQVEVILARVEEVLQMKLDRSSFRSFLSDLERVYLIRTNELEDLPEDGPKNPEYIITESGGFTGLMITHHGQRFLKFINGNGVR